MSAFLRAVGAGAPTAVGALVAALAFACLLLSTAGALAEDPVEMAEYQNGLLPANTYSALAGMGAVNLYNGDFTMAVPLISLPGRAGHDLNLTLTYNSKQISRFQYSSGGVDYDVDGYFYDGQGSRVIKVTGGVETRYYFGAGKYVSGSWTGAPLSARAHRHVRRRGRLPGQPPLRRDQGLVGHDRRSAQVHRPYARRRDGQRLRRRAITPIGRDAGWRPMCSVG